MYRIKSSANKSEHLLSEAGIWIRNFCSSTGNAQVKDQLLSEDEYALAINNEFENVKQGTQFIEPKSVTHPHIVIVSSGLDFADKQKVLCSLKKDVVVIGVNEALAQWSLVGSLCSPNEKRNLNYYVVNNPYKECLRFLPTRHKYYPKCVASSRTFPEFVKKYTGNKVFYSPTPDDRFSGMSKSRYLYLDDYRNPICAALHLSQRFGVKKLVLLCCDSSFKQDRPGSVSIGNDCYMYPQQIQSHQIIDGMLYWMKESGVEIRNCSASPNYTNCRYIDQGKIQEFFEQTHG